MNKQKQKTELLSKEAKLRSLRIWRAIVDTYPEKIRYQKHKEQLGVRRRAKNLLKELPFYGCD
jgi:hypothetical protein